MRLRDYSDLSTFESCKSQFARVQTKILVVFMRSANPVHLNRYAKPARDPHGQKCSTVEQHAERLNLHAHRFLEIIHIS